MPVFLLGLAVASIAATTIEVPLGYRLAREREEDLHFRARAYVAAIRSFYMAETTPQRRRLPTSLEELERDPRFPQKRHIRRLYDDPLAGKTGTPFRTVTGNPGPALPQGIIGVASTSRTPLLRRAGFKTNAGPTLGLKTAADLIFEVDLKELIATPHPSGTAPRPATQGNASRVSPALKQKPSQP